MAVYWRVRGILEQKGECVSERFFLLSEKNFVSLQTQNAGKKSPKPHALTTHNGLSNGVMAALQILVLSVQVRILVGQPSQCPAYFTRGCWAFIINAFPAKSSAREGVCEESCGQCVSFSEIACQFCRRRGCSRSFDSFDSFDSTVIILYNHSIAKICRTSITNRCVK